MRKTLSACLLIITVTGCNTSKRKDNNPIELEQKPSKPSSNREASSEDQVKTKFASILQGQPFQRITSLEEPPLLKAGQAFVIISDSLAKASNLIELGSFATSTTVDGDAILYHVVGETESHKLLETKQVLANLDSLRNGTVFAGNKPIIMSLPEKKLEDLKRNIRSKFGYAYDVETLTTEGAKVRIAIKSRYDETNYTTMLRQAKALGNRSLSDRDFTYHLIELISVHLNRPYRNLDKSDHEYKTTREIDGTPITVYRPNHPLDHGIRQGKIAVDIAKLIHSQGTEIKPEIKTYVEAKVASDPLFYRKLEFLAAFQRTGREDESGFENDSDSAYRNYGRTDVEFFKQASLESGLFQNDSEIDEYAIDLNDAAQNMGRTYPLGAILFAAHSLDLQRMIPFFTREDIARKVANTIGGHDTSRHVQILQDRTDSYLKANGVMGYLKFENKWFEQNSRHQLMADAVNLPLFPANSFCSIDPDWNFCFERDSSNFIHKETTADILLAQNKCWREQWTKNINSRSQVARSFSYYQGSGFLYINPKISHFSSFPIPHKSNQFPKFDSFDAPLDEDSLAATINVLNFTILTAPKNKYPVVIYRGLGDCKDSYITNPGRFLSTTSHPEIAWKWIQPAPFPYRNISLWWKWWQHSKKKGCFLRLELPAGFPMLFLELTQTVGYDSEGRESKPLEESEFLLPSHLLDKNLNLTPTQFEIISRQEKGTLNLREFDENGNIEEKQVIAPVITIRPKNALEFNGNSAFDDYQRKYIDTICSKNITGLDYLKSICALAKSCI